MLLKYLHIHHELPEIHTARSELNIQNFIVPKKINNNTWGCKGFPPVKTNGRIDKEATYELMRELFPENAIIYTHPTDERYWDMSELYA